MDVLVLCVVRAFSFHCFFSFWESVELCIDFASDECLSLNLTVTTDASIVCSEAVGCTASQCCVQRIFFCVASFVCATLSFYFLCLCFCLFEMWAEICHHHQSFIQNRLRTKWEKNNKYQARTCASVVPPIECPDDSVATAHPEQVICYSATGCTESDCCQPRLLCAVDFNEEACLALNQTFTRNASQACRDAVVCTAADCCIAGFFLFVSLLRIFCLYMCVENVVDFLFFFGGDLSVRHFLCFQCCCF